MLGRFDYSSGKDLGGHTKGNPQVSAGVVAECVPEANRFDFFSSQDKITSKYPRIGNRPGSILKTFLSVFHFLASSERLALQGDLGTPYGGRRGRFTDVTPAHRFTRSFHSQKMKMI